MMKKLLMLGLVLTFGLKVKAQAPPTATVITDTLHYYFNKYYYKTNTTMDNFKFYKSPAATFTGVTHLGSKFENSDTALRVTGLEAIIARNPSSANLSVPVRMYLCYIGNDGMPKLPAIDSVSFVATNPPSPHTLMMVGGNFTTARTVTANFAVLIRNMSTISADTVRIARTSGKTLNNANASASEKCSDGYGFVRFANKFYSTTNFTVSGFGTGTDYEFCVAPRVTYSMQASHNVPVEATETCVFNWLNFVNTSSPEISSRFFNLNEFCRKWNQPYAPFAASPAGGWPTDSAVTWFFESEDDLGKPGPRVFLPYYSSNNTIQWMTDSAWVDENDEEVVHCFPSNEFRTRWTSMGVYGAAQTFNTVQEFTVCTKYCNGTRAGIGQNSPLASVKLYPNPAQNGLTKVTGLTGSNTILVYDLTGKAILTEKTEKDAYIVDLRKYNSGAYMVRIVNQDGSSMVMRVLRD